jgi:hypothetical protein
VVRRANRQELLPQSFPDSHIKIGKYVYTFCSAVDILRTIEPKDKSLAVTQEMVDAVSANCVGPICANCIERNYYFMNQHSYAIMGFLAATILADDVERYKKAVEWTTANATAENQGRNGSIKQQIRLVTRNDKTGEQVEPNLQLVEMGRDMPHAEGNLTNLFMMSKTIDFQKTKVDPVSGVVTEKPNGVSPVHFLDDRLAKGMGLYAKYNLGYELPWVPTYSEIDVNHPESSATYDQISYFGRGSCGSAFHYYGLKGIGLDMDTGPYRYIKTAFDATAAGRESGARSGIYINQLHNYGFDFWIGLPAARIRRRAGPGESQASFGARSASAGGGEGRRSRGGHAIRVQLCRPVCSRPGWRRLSGLSSRYSFNCASRSRRHGVRADDVERTATFDRYVLRLPDANRLALTLRQAGAAGFLQRRKLREARAAADHLSPRHRRRVDLHQHETLRTAGFFTFRLPR